MPSAAIETRVHELLFHYLSQAKFVYKLDVGEAFITCADSMAGTRPIPSLVEEPGFAGIVRQHTLPLISSLSVRAIEEVATCLPRACDPRAGRTKLCQHAGRQAGFLGDQRRRRGAESRAQRSLHEADLWQASSHGAHADIQLRRNELFPSAPLSMQVCLDPCDPSVTRESGGVHEVVQGKEQADLVPLSLALLCSQ
eukprot:90640-Hanusia_phi.AAC.3